MKIHPTAIISSDATLAEGVEIGPYSIIGPDVHIGRNTIIGPHVVIETRADIGEENRISQFASIGGDPQDLKNTAGNRHGSSSATATRSGNMSRSAGPPSRISASR